MNGQLNIFEVLYPTYKITKPVRLIEFFAGYGSQALALKYLGVKFEHWKICEWAVKSIQAYKDIHFTDDNTDYSQPFEIDTLKRFLYNKGISSNYNEPMTKEQINRLSEQQIRTICNNITTTHNLVNIQQVKGRDLRIEDKEDYCYILTYSFPCQDLSLAGKGKGMSDTSTRSGMLWEVERILKELKETDSLPQVLLMENVPMVHSIDNTPDFNKWQLELIKLGYKNYWEDLIATDYGIPQTRNRCFMVSILGDYNYTFPKPIPLEKKLKDLLEDNVDEKYYLSDRMMNYITSKDDKYKVNESKLVINRDIACSKTTREGNTRADTTDYICDDLPENFNLKEGIKRRILANTVIENGMVKENDIIRINYTTRVLNGEKKWYLNNDKCPTLTTNSCDEYGVTIKIKNANSKGYLEATDGDGVDISSRMEYHRGTVQKGKTQTITTMGGENNGVVVKNYVKNINYEDDTFNTLGTNCGSSTSVGGGVVVLGNYTPSNHNASRIVDQEHSAPTVTENHGTITATQTSDLRIRKLTPKECFRLMGVKDEDFEKCAKNQSDSSLYHLAGDSIVVNILMAIFKEML